MSGTPASNLSSAIWLLMSCAAAVVLISSCSPSPTAEQLGADLATELSSGEMGLPASEGTRVEIFAEEDWYQARTEPELFIRGVLKPRDPAVGPGGRPSLMHQLVTEEGNLAVYAANAQSRLDPFLDHRVEVLGKLVDLEDEGFGEELWIAFIEEIEMESE